MWVNLSHMLSPLPPSLYAPSYCKTPTCASSDNNSLFLTRSACTQRLAHRHLVRYNKEWNKRCCRNINIASPGTPRSRCRRWSPWGKLCLLNLACVPSQARAATRSTAERSRFAAIIPVTALARYYGNVRLAPSYRRTGLELDSCSTPSPGSYALYHL